ncbi:dehydrogenase [Actinomycetospora sp. NBRC 106375]|uniref:MaoC family dehydratase n=1 Tax=Actinomycetospora sp. NBRC 106375 TaxID=3032207 RepID=UPI0024A3A121|nr:MaoC family dehydratase [Actinomycetospora sp. NBRC 106375]GLZ48143.1 dehydrogenase [Actinomycetospora sp. NBRC 106375]
MALRPDLVGTRSDAAEFSWTADDVMLYALAVGAGQGDPLEDLAFTTENTEGAPLKVLPTFANIITRAATVDLGEVDRTQLVHAEQTFLLHAPLPVAGRARVAATVTAVEDKGRGAIVRTQADAVDAATGAPLVTSVQSVFLGGEGGFGGPRGESAPSAIPERAPDHVVTVATRPEQALLYRLTGDRNPLHTDPAFAARGGFTRPILHGMCTYGLAARAVMCTVAGNDPDRVTGMTARFTRPVLPGDELTVAIWSDGGAAHFRTTCGDDVVLDRGRLDVA